MFKFDFNTALSSSFYLNDEHYIVQAHFESGEVGFWNEYVRLVQNELETDLKRLRRHLQKKVNHSGLKDVKMTYRHNGFVDPVSRRSSHLVILTIERKQPATTGNFDYFMPLNQVRPTMNIKQEPHIVKQEPIQEQSTHEPFTISLINDDSTQVTANQATSSQSGFVEWNENDGTSAGSSKNVTKSKPATMTTSSHMTNPLSGI